MGVSVNQLIVFKELSGSDECPYVLFEIPDTGIPCGQEMPIYLWADDSSLISGYSLKKDDADLGLGSIENVGNKEITEELSFAEKSSIQLERPVHSIENVNMSVALKGIYNEQGELTGTTDYDGDFIQKGGSCIATEDDIKIYGQGTITYKQAAYRKVWKWTVDCTRKDHWFFIYKDGVIKRKFSIAVDTENLALVPILRFVRIRAINFSNEFPIENATIFINGEEKGITDSEGNLDINLWSGQTYGLKITAPGYKDTDVDDIENDQIKVV